MDAGRGLRFRKSNIAASSALLQASDSALGWCAGEPLKFRKKRGILSLVFQLTHCIPSGICPAL